MDERKSVSRKIEADEYDAYSIPLAGFHQTDFGEELTTTGRIITSVKQDFYASLFKEVISSHGDDILLRSYTKPRLQPLIIFEEYRPQIESLLKDFSIDGAYVEYSRVMNDSACRSGKLLVRMGQVLHAYSKHILGARMAFLICPTDHLNMHMRLNKIAGQIPSTGIVNHQRVGGNPSIGLYVDLEKFNNCESYFLEVEDIAVKLKTLGKVNFEI
jgi:hypothetical protein